jgi:hypothetical protein
MDKAVIEERYTETVDALREGGWCGDPYGNLRNKRGVIVPTALIQQFIRLGREADEITASISGCRHQHDVFDLMHVADDMMKKQNRGAETWQESL